MNMFEQYPSAIGGYFELELSIEKEFPNQNSMKFQSARAAFLALIRAGNPCRIWMPRFICNAMLAPVNISGVECVWYDLDDQLNVDEAVVIDSDDWILYVNYFGVCNNNVVKLLKRFDPKKVVLDYSQAFFDPPVNEALAIIYSPRKFFGVPDGGLLISESISVCASIQDTGSLDRSSYLTKRLAYSPETGYEDYKKSEQSLEDCEPMRMSKFTERLLSSIDFERACSKRRNNFDYLHKKLGDINQFSINEKNIFSPMCYPFLTSSPKLKKKMIDNRIFVPTYWSDALARVGDQWGNKMINGLLPLPIDQRYGFGDMSQIVSIALGGG